MSGMTAQQLSNVLGNYAALPIKIQVGKRVFEVKGVLPMAAGSTDAILSVEKLAKVKEVRETVNINLTVALSVEKVTKKEKEKLVKAGVADNDQALLMAKAIAFLHKAKMRGCTIQSVK